MDARLDRVRKPIVQLGSKSSHVPDIEVCELTNRDVCELLAGKADDPGAHPYSPRSPAHYGEAVDSWDTKLQSLATSDRTARSYHTASKALNQYLSVRSNSYLLYKVCGT